MFFICDSMLVLFEVKYKLSLQIFQTKTRKGFQELQFYLEVKKRIAVFNKLKVLNTFNNSRKRTVISKKLNFVL
jgi:hypothetical protein